MNYSTLYKKRQGTNKRSRRKVDSLLGTMTNKQNENRPRRKSECIKRRSNQKIKQRNTQDDQQDTVLIKPSHSSSNVEFEVSLKKYSTSESSSRMQSLRISPILPLNRRITKDNSIPETIESNLVQSKSQVVKDVSALANGPKSHRARLIDKLEEFKMERDALLLVKGIVTAMTEEINLKDQIIQNYKLKTEDLSAKADIKSQEIETLKSKLSSCSKNAGKERFSSNNLSKLIKETKNTRSPLSISYNQSRCIRLKSKFQLRHRDQMQFVHTFYSSGVSLDTLTT